MIPRLALSLALGAALIGGVLLGARWLVKTGERLQEAEYRAAQAEYDRAQLARIQRANDAYRTANQGLQERVTGLLANPPTRTIRVRVPAACEPQKPAEAGLPTVDPPERYVDVVDEGYPVFREWLIRYAAGPDNGGRTDETVPDSR